MTSIAWWTLGVYVFAQVNRFKKLNLTSLFAFQAKHSVDLILVENCICLNEKRELASIANFCHVHQNEVLILKCGQKVDIEDKKIWVQKYRLKREEKDFALI